MNQMITDDNKLITDGSEKWKDDPPENTKLLKKTVE